MSKVDPFRAALSLYGINPRIRRKELEGEALYTVRYTAVFYTANYIQTDLKKRFQDRFAGLHSFRSGETVVLEAVFFRPLPPVQMCFEDYLSGGFR